MFATLLHEANQEYFIEAVDTYFALSLEKTKQQSDSQSLIEFNQKDLIEGSNEQLNVKFCEDLLEDDEELSISTEGTSDSFESINEKENNKEKDKEKDRKVSLRDFIIFSDDSIKKHKDDYVTNIRKQFEIIRKMTMAYYQNMYNMQMNKAASSSLTTTSVINNTSQLNKDNKNKYSIAYNSPIDSDIIIKTKNKNSDLNSL